MRYSKNIAAIIIFFYSFHSIAQKDIEVGIEIGPSIVSLRGNEVSDNHGVAIRMVAGFSLEYLISEKISLKSGLLYERKGSKFQYGGLIVDEFGNPTNETLDTNHYFDYLNLPLMVKYKYGNKLKFFINTGPYIGYLLKHTSKIELLESHDTTNLYKRIDVGLSAGVGIEVPLNEKIGFIIEIRDNLGLLNISKVPIINDDTLKTNSLNILVAFIYKT